METASERGKYVSQDPLPPLNFEPSFEECAMECNYSAEPTTEETDFNGMNQLVLQADRQDAGAWSNMLKC